MAGEALQALNTMGEQLVKALGPGFGTFQTAGSQTVAAPAATPEAAVGTVTIESLAKSVGEMQAQIATIAEAIKPKTETAEAGDLRKSVDTMVESFETYGTVMEKALDRIEALEGNGPMRKSAGGDEVLASQGTTPVTPAASTNGQEAMTKTVGAGQRAGGWDNMLKGMRNNPGKAVFLR